MTDRERVAHALQTERDGNDFYDRVSAHAARKLTRAAFVMLSKEESRHIDTIESLAKFLDGGNVTGVVTGLTSPFGIAIPEPASITLLTLGGWAIIRIRRRRQPSTR